MNPGTLLSGLVTGLAALLDITVVVLAVANWRRHPRASALAVAAAAVSFFSFGARMAVPSLVQRFSADTSAMMVGYAGVGLVSLVGQGCLVAAVFTDRTGRL